MKSTLTSADFRLFKQEKRFHGDFFTLAVGSILGNQRTQWACVVSKKVSPRATTRNIVKRRCRALLQRATLPKDSRALVFFAKPTASRASFTEISQDIEFLLSRALSSRS